MLDEHQEEENKGFKVNVKAPVKTSLVDDYEDEFIDEEIQSEYDNFNNGSNTNRLAESIENSARGGFAVTVSQSLGIDKSVDSLALDDYDHIEFVE